MLKIRGSFNQKFKKRSHLLIYLSNRSSSRLLFRLHPSSWNDPLIWMSTAANKQNLPHTYSQTELSQIDRIQILINTLSEHLDYITESNLILLTVHQSAKIPSIW